MQLWSGRQYANQQRKPLLSEYSLPKTGINAAHNLQTEPKDIFTSQEEEEPAAKGPRNLFC